MIGGLEEVHLSVSDLGTMRTFYVEVLGLKEEFYHDGRMLGLDTGGAMLVLESRERPASGVGLTFGCKEVEHVLEELSEKGVTVTIPLEAGHWGAKVAGFEDPEANTVYLEEPPTS
ncbi:MAG: VOC family protein [Thermoplasmata archaeon]